MDENLKDFLSPDNENAKYLSELKHYGIIFFYWENYIWYFLEKIFLRILLTIIFVFLLNTLSPEGILTNDGKIWAFLIILFILFLKFPPEISTLYLIPKNIKKDNMLPKLLKITKQTTSGFCQLNGSYVIKGKTQTAMFRREQDLSQYITLDDYEKIYGKDTLKGYEKH